LIADHWDDLLRVAGSLLQRHSTGSHAARPGRLPIAEGGAVRRGGRLMGNTGGAGRSWPKMGQNPWSQYRD
ncbi:MAG TPA: hypothetical protein VKP89_11665, partial [Burkholderiales bacterium]|nr:hypothetical protein [Burkholderiales bacterium]